MQGLVHDPMSQYNGYAGFIRHLRSMLPAVLRPSSASSWLTLHCNLRHCKQGKAVLCFVCGQATAPEASESYVTASLPQAETAQCCGSQGEDSVLQ